MKSILIVDDDVAVGDALRRTLARAGFAVSVVSQPEQALDAYRAAPADLVITDIIMPVVDGVELTRRLRQEFPDARIVAISGGGNFGIANYRPEAITTDAYLTAATKAGADRVLTKPFETSELLGVIRSLLDRH